MLQSSVFIWNDLMLELKVLYTPIYCIYQEWYDVETWHIIYSSLVISSEVIRCYNLSSYMLQSSVFIFY